MEEKQKKTAKAVNKTETNKTVKTANKTAEKKTTKAVKPEEKKKTTRVTKESASKPVKVVKETAAKKATKTVKENIESKPVKAVKETAAKKTVKTVKEPVEKKTVKAVKETVKKTTKAKANKEDEKVVKNNSTKRAVKAAKEIEEKKPVKAVKVTSEIEKAKPAKKVAQEKVVEVKNEVSKKTLNISMGTILAIIIILGLVVLIIQLGKYAYNLNKKDTTTDNEIETSSNQSTTQEIGNVINKNNEVVPKIINQITFSPKVTASIYSEGEFTAESMPNDLKLKMGWSKTKNESILKSINENNEEVETIEKMTMDETIKTVLGPTTESKGESFDYAKVTSFAASDEKVTYSAGLYTKISKNLQEEKTPFIYQEVQKVVRYSEKIILYVKTVYIVVEDGKYIVYKGYENNEFTEKLFEIKPEELLGDVIIDQNSGEGSITIEPNAKLDDIRNQLDTYKYTFKLDGSTQEYYLSEFGKDK